MNQSSQIKIMLIVPSLVAGGAERFMSILANHLDIAKFEVHLVIISGKNHFFRINRSVKVYDLKTERVSRAIFKIRKKIYEVKPQVVFSTMGHLNLLLAIFRFAFPKNIRFIARETSIIDTAFEEENNALSFLFYKKLYQWFSKNLDLIICQSLDMKTAFEKIGGRHPNLFVINNPINVSTIQKQLNTPSQSIEKYDLVSVGRLSYEKGYDRLIEVLKAYKNRYGVVPKTAIIGAGSEKRNLVDAIQLAGLTTDVHLLGQKKNPFIYFKNARLFCMTSRHEGFPNVLLEAGACGLPFVAFNVPGGIKEIIQSGKNGFLAKDEDIAGMAQLINHALHYSFNSNWIKNYTQSNFGLVHIIKKYETIIQSVVEVKSNIRHSEAPHLSDTPRGPGDIYPFRYTPLNTLAASNKNKQKKTNE